MEHILISYAREDEDFVHDLANKLQQNHKVWTDHDIERGEDWRNQIDQAILNSFLVIVVVTEASMNSAYVTYEWSYAMGLGTKVIPLIRRAVEEMHPKLSVLQWIDMTNPGFNWDDFSQEIDRIRRQTVIETTRNLKGDISYLIQEGRKAVEENNPVTAIRILESAQELSDETLQDVIHHLKGMAYILDNDDDSAEDSFKHAVNINPDYVPSLTALGGLLRSQADKIDDKNQKQKLLNEALEMFLHAVKVNDNARDGNEESLWTSVGSIHKRLGQLELAIEAYQKATNIHPSSYPYINLVLLYLDTGNIPKMNLCLQLVERFSRSRLNLNPADCFAHSDYLLTLIIAKDFESAKTELFILNEYIFEYAKQSLVRTLSSFAQNKQLDEKISQFASYAIDVLTV